MPEIPVAQRARAEAMLRTVKNETGFGAGKEPLPFVRTVVERLGYPWGLNGKRGNANDISRDILAFDVPGQQPVLVDVLIDGGGQNGLTFDIKGWPEPAGAVFIQVGPPPVPPSPPVIPGFDFGPELQAVQTALRDLNRSVESLKRSLDSLKGSSDSIAQRTNALEASVRTLAERPAPPVSVTFPAYVGRLGVNLRLTPE